MHENTKMTYLSSGWNIEGKKYFAKAKAYVKEQRKEHLDEMTEIWSNRYGSRYKQGKGKRNTEPPPSNQSENNEDEDGDDNKVYSLAELESGQVNETDIDYA